MKNTAVKYQTSINWNLIEWDMDDTFGYSRAIGYSLDFK